MTYRCENKMFVMYYPYFIIKKPKLTESSYCSLMKDNIQEYLYLINYGFNFSSHVLLSVLVHYHPPIPTNINTCIPPLVLKSCKTKFNE